MGDLAGLQDSIKRVGVIHSIVVDDKPTADNKWKLIAGGRRHMACTLAGVLEIPTDFFSEITELRLREIELDENGPRKDMEAMEQINLTAEIDSIKRNKIALKGPVATPIGTGFVSSNVRLRKALDLYANLRPVKNLPGVKSRFENVDIVSDATGQRVRQTRFVEQLQTQPELEAQVEVAWMKFLAAAQHRDRRFLRTGAPQRLAQHAAADRGQRVEVSVLGELAQTRSFVLGIRQERSQLRAPRIVSVEQRRDFTNARRAGGWKNQPHQKLDSGGLTGAVGPEEAKNFPVLDAHGQPFERSPLLQVQEPKGVILAQIFDFNRRSWHTHIF